MENPEQKQKVFYTIITKTAVIPTNKIVAAQFIDGEHRVKLITGSSMLIDAETYQAIINYFENGNK